MNPLEPEDPRRVGGFALVGRLGAGGMGLVFLGRTPSGRALAVKTVHPHLADDPQFRTRFRREVAAASRVRGEFTAEVVAADADDDPPWMATEYVDGPSLTDAVQAGGPLTVPEVWRLAARIARALVAIHDAGLVHRDLKPSNVVLGPDGPKVIDFGIARAADASVLTSTGVAIGTAGFMAPEQVAAGTVTPASDVFSLGALLFWAATGRNPFGDDAPLALMYRVVHAEPDLHRIQDAELHHLLRTCLARAPEDRPTPEEVASTADSALESDLPTVLREVPRPGPAASGDGGTEPPAGTGPTGPTGPVPVSRRTVLLIGGGLAVAGVGGAFAAMSRNTGSVSSVAASSSVTSPVTSPSASITTSSPSAVAVVATSSAAPSRPWGHAPTSTGPLPARRRLTAVRTGTLWARDASASSLDAMAVTWAPDGGVLAAAQGDRFTGSVVRYWSTTNGATSAGRTLRVPSPGLTRMALSSATGRAGGQLLAVTDADNQFRLFDAPSGRPRASPLTSPGSREDNQLGITPDGTRVLLDKVLYDIGNSDGVWFSGAAAGAFSPDGTLLAAAGTAVLELVDLGTATTVWTVPLAGLGSHDDVAAHVAFAPDGRTVLVAGQWVDPRSTLPDPERPRRTWVWFCDLATSRVWGGDREFSGGIAGAGFLQQGRTAVAATTDGALLLWDVAARGPATARSLAAPLRCLAVDPRPSSARFVVGSERDGLTSWSVRG